MAKAPKQVNNPILDGPVPAAARSSAGPAAAAAGDTDEAALRASGITSGMIALKSQLRAQLFNPGAVAAAAAAAAPGPGGPLLGPDNIVSLGYGMQRSREKLTGRLALIVGVRTKDDAGRVVPSMFIPPEETVGGEKVHIDVLPVGTPKASVFQQNEIVRGVSKARWGACVGLQTSQSSGTIGCTVRLNDGKFCILSNNHVLANSNNARPRDAFSGYDGDRIVQAGNFSNGGAGTVMATLEAFVPLTLQQFKDPNPKNRIDAAVAWTHDALMDKRHHSDISFNPAPVPPRLFATVFKEGMRTGVTQGTIMQIGVELHVGYGNMGAPPYASFNNQVYIEGFGGKFSDQGDSGSLVITWVDNEFRPTALMFADDDRNGTWAHNIQDVLDHPSLNISGIEYAA